MITYQVTLQCDGIDGGVCTNVLMHGATLSSFEGVSAVYKYARQSGWKLLKTEALCPECYAKRKKKPHERNL